MFALARAITQFNIFIGRWASLAVLVFFGLLLSAVISRYWVGSPKVWTGELALLIFGGYAIIGGGYLHAERLHVNVDIFYGRFSLKQKALVDVITWPLFLLFVGVLLWKGFDVASDAITRHEESKSLWKAPLWPVKILIPIAALLLLLQGFVRLWADIRILRGLPVPEDIFGKSAASPDTDHPQETGL